ncbi:MAG: leucine-rich repeat protein, partial [Paludibacteraceae bacterium]
MKKFNVLLVALIAAMSMQAQVWQVVDEMLSAGDSIARAGVWQSVGSFDGLTAYLYDGAGWTVKSTWTEEFTGKDCINYAKSYIQGTTNGVQGSLFYEKTGNVSAHLEFQATVPGVVYIAAQYGSTKPIWAAKVPNEVIENGELNYADLTAYLIPGFSEASNVDGVITMTKGMYINDNGAALQETTPLATTFAVVPLEVEPGYTYYYWVSGSRLMLSGLHFTQKVTTLRAKIPTNEECSPNAIWNKGVEDSDGNITPNVYMTACVWNDNMSGRLVPMSQEGDYHVLQVTDEDEFSVLFVAGQVTSWSTVNYLYEQTVDLQHVKTDLCLQITNFDVNEPNTKCGVQVLDCTTGAPSMEIYTINPDYNWGNSLLNGYVEGSGSYIGEQDIVISAWPYPGYRFAGWEDGSMEQTRTVHLVSDTIMTPLFVRTIANTKEYPYSVLEAIQLINAGEALTDSVYVIGIVTNLAYRSDYQNINVWVRDEDGNTMEFYAMQGLDSALILSEEEMNELVQVGDTLIAKGTLKHYYNANTGEDFDELYRGCYAIEVRKNMDNVFHTVRLKGKELRVSYYYIDDYGDLQYEDKGGWIEDIELSIRHGLSVHVYESTSGLCDMFLRWSDGVTENSRTITITSDTTIASEIYTQTYHAEITAGEGGRIYGDYWGDGDFIGDVPCDGYSYYIRAYANDGYYFVGWSDGISNSSRTIHIYSDTTVTAIFKKYCTVTINGGAVSGEYRYLDNYGEWSTSSFSRTFHKTVYMREGQITVRENADCGKWLGWSDGVMDRERTIDVVGDTVIESSFDSEYYTVQIMPTKGGYIRNPYTEEEVYINNKIYACTNYSQDLRAYPYEGYYFKGWSNGVKNDEQYVYLDHNMTLLAIFDTIVPATVTAAPADGCEEMGTITGGGRYLTGDQVTVVATPKAGYHFVEWSDGYGRPEYTFTLSSDTTIYAIFAQGENMGKCGKDLYWTCEDSLLTITGTGAMDVRNYYTWRDTKVGINRVSLPEGLTYMEGNEFSGRNIRLKELVIPASVEAMEEFYIDEDYCVIEHLEYLGNSMQMDYYGFAPSAYYVKMPGEFFITVYSITGGKDFSCHMDTMIVTNGELNLGWSNDYNYCLSYNSVAMPRYVDLANASNTTLDNIHHLFTKQLRTLYLPSQLEVVSEEALKGCQYLSSVVIPATVVEIAPNAFEDCRSMTSVVFAGNKVETIGDWAFYNCHSLRNLTLPEGVEEVGLAAFYGCTYLNELTIPSTMKKIADNGFAGCEKMQTMYVNALVPPTIEAKTFEDVDRATPVFVPRGTMELYQADPYWSEFFNMAEYDAPTGNLSTSADE